MKKISNIKLLLILLFLLLQTVAFSQLDYHKANEIVKTDNNPIILEAKQKNVVFRIQIGASKSKLSGEKIKAIWNDYIPGTTPHYEETEGEWYKYLIGDYTSYEEACLAEEEMQVKGSFIVAFIEGWKRVENIEDVCTPYKHPCYNRNK